MKVSVIIPVYNVEKYLRQCLDSLLVQTLDGFEIICVDDGSRDSSPLILDEYAKSHSNIKIITQKNEYAGVARNKGMQIATGDYLVFLDSDDFFEPDMLLLMYDKCIEQNADLCVCDMDKYDDPTGTFFRYGCLNMREIPKKQVFSRSELGSDVFSFTYPGPSNKMFRREFVQKHNLQFQNTQRVNDVYFVCLSMALAQRICVVPKILVHYRVGLKNNLQSGHSKSPLDAVFAKVRLRQSLIEAGVFSGKLKQSFDDQTLRQLVYSVNKLKDDEHGFTELYDWYFSAGQNELATDFSLADYNTLTIAALQFDGISNGGNAKKAFEIIGKNLSTMNTGKMAKKFYRFCFLVKRAGFFRTLGSALSHIRKKLAGKLKNR